MRHFNYKNIILIGSLLLNVVIDYNIFNDDNERFLRNLAIIKRNVEDILLNILIIGT